MSLEPFRPWNGGVLADMGVHYFCATTANNQSSGRLRATIL
jgi:hypothetical protein